jgi:hypothetical protein
MYPNKSNGLAVQFPLFKDKIIELGKKKAKQNESDIPSALEKLESNDNPGW